MIKWAVLLPDISQSKQNSDTFYTPCVVFKKKHKMSILQNLLFRISFGVSFILFTVDSAEGRGFRSYGRHGGGSAMSSTGGMIAGFVLLGLVLLILIGVLIYRCYAMKKQGRTFCQSKTNRTQPSTVTNESRPTTSPPKGAPPPYRNNYLPAYSTYTPPPAYTWPNSSQDPVYPPLPPASNY